MSSHFSAVLTFGGALARSDIAIIAEALYLDGAGSEWGEPFPSAAEAEAHLIAGAEAGESVTVYDEQARGGTLGTTEPALTRFGLSWMRDAEGEGTAGWDRQIWTPADGEKFCPITESDPMISLTELRRLMTEGRTIEQVVSGLAAFDPAIPPLTIA